MPMDDLISRKTLLDDLCEDRVEGTFEFTESQAEAADKIVRYVNGRIEAQPSIPAVPLDKLCELLAKHLGFYLCDTSVDCGKCSGGIEKRIECWRRILTRWMEGLGVS